MLRRGGPLPRDRAALRLRGARRVHRRRAPCGGVAARRSAGARARGVGRDAVAAPAVGAGRRARRAARRRGEPAVGHRPRRGRRRRRGRGARPRARGGRQDESAARALPPPCHAARARPAVRRGADRAAGVCPLRRAEARPGPERPLAADRRAAAQRPRLAGVRGRAGRRGRLRRSPGRRGRDVARRGAARADRGALRRAGRGGSTSRSRASRPAPATTPAAPRRRWPSTRSSRASRRPRSRPAWCSWARAPPGRRACARTCGARASTRAAAVVLEIGPCGGGSPAWAAPACTAARGGRARCGRAGHAAARAPPARSAPAAHPGGPRSSASTSAASPPRAHQPDDTPEHVDPAAALGAVDLALGLADALDAELARSRPVAAAAAG